MISAPDGATLASTLDRLAIRDLIDAYARHADRRDPVAQAAVFADHGQVRLFTADPTTAGSPDGTAADNPAHEDTSAAGTAPAATAVDGVAQSADHQR